MTQIDISTARSPSCNTYFGTFSTYNINVIFTVSIELSIQTSMTIFMITDLPCICNVFTFTVCLAFTFRSCNFYRIAVYNNILIFGYVYCDIFYFYSFVAYCYRCTCCCFTFCKIAGSNNTSRIYSCNSFIVGFPSYIRGRIISFSSRTFVSPAAFAFTTPSESTDATVGLSTVHVIGSVASPSPVASITL